MISTLIHSKDKIIQHDVITRPRLRGAALASLVSKVINSTTEPVCKYGASSLPALVKIPKSHNRVLTWAQTMHRPRISKVSLSYNKKTYLFLNTSTFTFKPLFYYMKPQTQDSKKKVLSLFTDQMLCLVELLSSLFVCNFTLFLNVREPTIRDPKLLNHVCRIAYSGHYLSRLNIVMALSYYCFLAYSKIEFLWTYLTNISGNSMYKDQRQMYRYL